jgi:hypothetical protein
MFRKSARLHRTRVVLPSALALLLLGALLSGVLAAPGRAQGAEPAAAPPPSEPSTPSLYAEAYRLFSRGELAAATPLFEQVLRREPKHPSARNYLVECYAALGRADDAKRIAGGEPPAAALQPAAATTPAPAPPAPPAPPATAPATAASEAHAPPPAPPAAGAESPEAQSPAAAAPPPPPPTESAEAEDRDEGRDGGRGDERRAEEPEAELSPEERAFRRNPRSRGHGAAGFAIAGSTLGLGAWIELRPHWIVAILGGAGGSPTGWDAACCGVPRGGVFSAFAELELRPVPWRLTPVLGFGATLLAGDGAWKADLSGRPIYLGAPGRLLPYGSVGLRYDAPSGFVLGAGAGFVPTGQAQAPILVVPGLRIGFRF